jgi:16S rRNA (adenine1518-N6/adenine1519-N6)-dimethyltransferase
MRTPKDIIFDYQIKPQKKMGQCFLVNRQVMESIVAFAGIRSRDVVVEIGAGLGVLTELIAQKTGKVIAVELDKKLVDVLRERLGKYENVKICCGDILKFDFEAVLAGDNLKIKVIGNVPYHISSALIFRLLSFRKAINSFVLMLQKEVAKRLVADPRGQDYGVPSVLLQMFADVRPLLDVPSESFYPKPKVESMVIKGVFFEKPAMELLDEDFFFRLVKASFAQRRKMLMNNLKKSKLLEGTSESSITEALRLAGIDGQRRGETLTKEEYGYLSNYLKKMIKT